MAKHYCKTQQFWMSLYDFSILTLELHGFPINIDPAASLFTHLMLAFAAALPSFENVQGRKALRQFLAAAAAAVGRGRGRSRHAENLVCSSRVPMSGRRISRGQMCAVVDHRREKFD